MLMQPLIWLLGPIGFQEILVVLLILLVLFGGRKIPELARGLGRGITEFKHGIRDEPESDKEKLPPEGVSKGTSAGASGGASGGESGGNDDK